MKTAERLEARRLRTAEGCSIREIAHRVGVSRSSASLWVRDIVLTPSQIDALRRRDPRFDAARNGSAANAERARARRMEAQREGRRRARDADRRYAAGCMLYWAEGSRTRNSVRFTNSDPEMMSFFVDFLRECFHVVDEKMRVTCNLFADHERDQRRIERFWLDTLRLPDSCLRTSTVNRYSQHSGRKRLNVLPYGTCLLAVHDTWLVQVIYGSIQQLAGFTRPAWLDL